MQRSSSLHTYSAPAMECRLSNVQMMESSKTLSFLGMRSAAPRPLSEATDIETDFEDDESTPNSMESMDNDSQTTVSEDLPTPASVGLSEFDFHFDQKPMTQGPSGPHLFRASSVEPVTEQSQDPDFYLKMSPVHDLQSTRQHRTLESLNHAVAELDDTQVRSWSPRQVAEWMREAGFDRSVVDKFLIHDISGVVLLDLQFEDLRELDITSYGKRHRVMSSIQHLRNSSLLSISPVSSAAQSSSSSRRRGRMNRTQSGDDISPAESISIVAIEQVLPKPHKCSKGENCSKWQKQQRKLQRLREEFPIETESSVIRPTSEVVPSVVASSDVLGQSELPTFTLTRESLNEVRRTDPQENVRHFLDYQHVESEEPEQQSISNPHLSEHLRHLPRLTIPAEAPGYPPMTPASPASSRRTRTPNSARRHYAKAQLRNDPYHYGGVASPVDLYRLDTPQSATDLPVTLVAIDPLDRETSQSVPPNMRYGGASTPAVVEPVLRPQSTQPRHHRRQLSFVPSVAPLVESPTLESHFSAPSTASPATEIVSDIAHSGTMRKRKTTKLFCHEWQDHHFTLKGTNLAMHKDEASAKRDSLALERIDVDDYAVAVSSLASSSKLSAAFKKSILGNGYKGADGKTYAFSLIPTDNKRQIFSEGKKSHHFAVESRDDRIDWMREIMLAKALKKGKAMGSEVRISGNLI